MQQVEPPWGGRLSDSPLMFEALALMPCEQMPFAPAARLMREIRHRVSTLYERYIELAPVQIDFSAIQQLAITETITSSRV